MLGAGTDDIARTLVDAPMGLGRLCADLCRQHLVDDAIVAASRVRRYTDHQLEPGALVAAGTELVDLLDAAARP